MTDPAKLAPAAILAITMLIAACESAVTVQPTPEIIIPPGVISTQTADQVAQRMLEVIAANERILGGRMAEPRIVRIQLLGAGEAYMMHRLDGTGDFLEMVPADAPGWMVEAVGTFTNADPPEVPSKWGVHGVHIWIDDGGEIWHFIPCGGTEPIPFDQREGICR